MQTIWVEAFLAIVDHRGFAAAAARLYRSQGRISSYVAALEKELHAPLFDRSQRPARLTAEGEAFLPYARAMLETLSAARAATADVLGLQRGDVAIGTFPSAAAFFMTSVMAALAADLPGIDVRLVERRARALDVAFDADEFEMMVRPMMPQASCRTPFLYEPLWREGICAILPDRHRLSSRHEIAADELAEEPLAIGGRSAEDAEISALLDRLGVRPEIKHISTQPASIVAFAQRGLAVGVMNMLATRGIDLGGVTVVPLESGITREVGLYSRARVSLGAAASVLRDAIFTVALPAGVTDLRAGPAQRT